MGRNRGLIVPLRTRLVFAHAFGVLLAAALCAACSKPDPTPVTAPAAVSAQASDRLEPNEIAEGEENAFGLRLPRELRVLTREPFSVYGEGEIPSDKVANYVRKRVVGDSAEHGSAKTVFHKAEALGIENPVPVRIEVVHLGSRTGLAIYDLRPQKIDLPPAPDDRMKQYGLSPDGKMLNRDRLH